MTGVLIVQTMLITFFVCIRMTIKKQLLARLRQAILEVYQGPLETNLLSLSIVWDWIMYHVSTKRDFESMIRSMLCSSNVVEWKIKMILI